MIQAWKTQGVGLVIVQAFPRGDYKYDIQLQQMQTCYYGKMPFECYIYDYMGTTTWRDGALAGLTVLSALRPGRVWADEEDTASALALSLLSRYNAVNDTLKAINAAGFQTGIYTGRWFWRGYMNNTNTFREQPLWDSNYDGIADASVDFIPYGGWKSCTYKQYAGSQTDGTDLDVTS